MSEHKYPNQCVIKHMAKDHYLTNYYVDILLYDKMRPHFSAQYITPSTFGTLIQNKISD